MINPVILKKINQFSHSEIIDIFIIKMAKSLYFESSIHYL